MADNNPQGRPLSWSEARARLRELLEKYLSEPSLICRKVNNVNVQAGVSATHETTAAAAATTSTTTTAEKTFLSWWILGDLDLYAGSLPLSIALFILACVSLHERKDPGHSHLGLHPAAKLSIYRGELAASVFLMVGSIVSLWMVRRRRFLCNNDGENAKRREILRFLRTVASDKQSGGDKENAGHTGAAAAMAGFGDSVSMGVAVAGTALTDIYPVYRQSGSGDNAVASWARIPSLLLVAGDYIALQVGDIAPASCAIVDPSSSNKVSTIASGDRIELSSFGNTLASVMNQLPRGRSTLPMDSDHLLTICNKMRVFRVQKAPLDDFIHRSQGKSAHKHEPFTVYSFRKSELTVTTFSSSFQAIADLEANKCNAGSSVGYCDSCLGSNGSCRIFKTRRYVGRSFTYFAIAFTSCARCLAGCGPGLYFLSGSTWNGAHSCNGPSACEF
jgi:hypothetical protein